MLYFLFMILTTMGVQILCPASPRLYISSLITSRCGEAFGKEGLQISADAKRSRGLGGNAALTRFARNSHAAIANMWNK